MVGGMMNLNRSNQVKPFDEALKIAFIYFIGSSFWIFFILFIIIPKLIIS